MIFALSFIVIGLVQLAWAAWAIRTNAAEDRISFIELVTLRLSGSEPLPKSRSEAAFDRAMQWLVLLLGLVFFAIGLLIVWSEI